MAFRPILPCTHPLPQSSRQEDDTTAAAISADLSIYSISYSLRRLLFPFGFVKWTLLRSSERGGLILCRQLACTEA